jgi:excisionase family DNA binding protein
VIDWLTPEEAATYLRVTRRTLYRWMEQGRLPWYELEPGGRRRFKREDLDRLLRPGVGPRERDQADDAGDEEGR